MSKSGVLSIVGVCLLELDTWVMRTMWLALLGVVLLVYSMALIAREEN